MPHVAGCIPLPTDDGRLTGRAWLALTLGAATLLVLTYVTEPSVFSSIDWLRIHVFYKEYLAAAIHQGRLPLWNPHVALGRPFLADVDSVVFYPPSAAYLFLEVHLACALGIGLHLLLGLYGTLRLARAMGIARAASWAAAFAFVASAPIVGSFSSGLINYGAALCYIPLVFYLLLRLQAGRSLRRVALLGLVLGFQILAGHPQATWLTCLGAGLLLAGRRIGWPAGPALKALSFDLAALCVAGLAAAAMAAVVLLPLGELAGQSNRQAPTLSFAASFAMNPLGWLTLASPNDPHTPVMANFQLYAGVVVFLAAPYALLRWREANARALVLVLACAGLLAAGNATPVFRIFYHLIPGLAHFRIPARATVLMTLSLILAAGKFFSVAPPRRFGVGLAVAALTALAAAWTSAQITANYGGPAHLSCARSFAGWQSVLVLLVAGLLVLWWQRGRLRTPRATVIVATLLAALTVADLAVATAKLRSENREVPAEAAETRLAKALVARGLLGTGGIPPRIAVPPRLAFENSGMRHGWSTFSGYASMMLGRVWNYIHAGIGLELPTEQVVYPEGEILTRGPFAYDSMALQVGVEPSTNRLVLRNSPDARAYLVPAALRVRGHQEATLRMRDGHPFHQVALVERPLPAGIATVRDDTFAGRAEITRYEPERVDVRADSPRPALLVLAESWFPGWQAQVNGQPAECFPANAWMRAVLVPAGTSEVVLTYRSTYFALGAGISLATFALLLLLSALPGKRKGVTSPVWGSAQ